MTTGTFRTKHIFGPVASHRLGASLGVDLIYHKLCTLNCMYCECGPTTFQTLKRRAYIPVSPVIAELNSVLPELEGKLNFVTFAGSGEPTLSTEIRPICDAVHSLTSTPIAMLTNGTILYRPDVIEDIQDIDVLIPSLDAADPDVFNILNKPHPDLDFYQYIEGLKQLKSVFKGKVWLEVLLVKQINDKPDHLKHLADIINEIDPDEIQLHTAIRPGAYPGIKKLSPEELEEAAAIMNIKPQKQASRKHIPINNSATLDGVTTAILEVLQRRPSSQSDLIESLGFPPIRVIKGLNRLEHVRSIERIEENEKTFFRIVKSK